MTRGKFEEYKFSINTQVKSHGRWFPIREVWFGEESVVTQENGVFRISEIEGLRESPTQDS